MLRMSRMAHRHPAPLPQSPRVEAPANLSRRSTAHINAALAFTACAFGLTTFAVPFALPPDVVSRQLREDSPLEYLQAALLGVTAVLFLLCALQRPGASRGRSYSHVSFLGLAAIFTFGAGEEISWGQRILRFKTPATLAAMNVQHEFTVHNLPAFDPASGSPLKMDRLFHLFWFVGGVATPVLAWAVPALRQRFEGIGVPIVPLLLGGQFLLFYGLSKLYEPLGKTPAEFGYRLTELREAQHSLIFALIALSFFLRLRAQRRADGPQTQPVAVES
jgi:hypothetical protein